MKILVVESPAKAKTIKKYLGAGYAVVASFGHVRDLPSAKGSVKPEEDFFMLYEVSKDGAKHLSNIAKLLKGAEILYLATDPDREGEAISWHVIEALKKQRKLPKALKVQRVTFNEITKNAILQAIKNAREINMDLVNAQQARRALDYLVGFNLSPLLWRKLPGSRSAGRVQSVALRLLCEREAEIEAFKSQEYWSLNLLLKNLQSEEFKAQVIEYAGNKLEKLSIKNQQEAEKIEQEARDKQYQVSDISYLTTKRKPQPPFTTSTLQQEGVKRLGLGTKRTMQIAQRLYEGVEIDGQLTGLITYMRTDGVDISKDALADIRDVIGQKYGADYLPASANIYKNKVKNAQEAHEAVRPTNFSLAPDKIRNYLDDNQYDLYKLIWNRTLASQMKPAVINTTKVTIISLDKIIKARVSGSVVAFPGFYAILPPQAKDEAFLPKLNEGEDLELLDIISKQHFTEPPARYNEASIVKKLEELGIGRPSTYATIISILIDREYAKLESKRFVPQERGRIVTSFLTSFFSKYVEYDFTAKLEEELDEISNGKLLWKKFLSDFWQGFNDQISDTSTKQNSDIIEKITEDLKDHYFPDKEDGSDPRSCPECESGKLSIKTGKFGAFIACSAYPECKHTKRIIEAGQEQAAGDGNANVEDQHIGASEDGNEILLRKGPYGFYLQTELEGKKKRVSIPKHIDPKQISLELARKLISLPRLVGMHPETNAEVRANYGKFGPYLQYQGKFYAAKNEDILELGINRAVTLIAESQKQSAEKGSANILQEIGNYPKSDKAIVLMKGRYGPYLKYNSKNYALPKGENIERLDVEKAVEIINKKKK